MTEEIKKKIEDKVESYSFQVPYNGTNDFYNETKAKSFTDGAHFGYSLAADRIKELGELLKTQILYRAVKCSDRKPPSRMRTHVINFGNKHGGKKDVAVYNPGNPQSEKRWKESIEYWLEPVPITT